MSRGQSDPRLLDLIQRSIDSGDHAKYLLEQLREAGYVVIKTVGAERIQITPRGQSASSS